MNHAFLAVSASFALACVISVLNGCDKDASTSGGSGNSGGGISGVYTSVESDGLRFEFASDGTVIASMDGEEGQPGTYKVDGEKIIVQMPESMAVTFIRDGDCIEDQQKLYGKLCKGGAAGAAKNISTRTPPPTSGTWVATNDDGEFTIEFESAEKFVFSFNPAPNSQMGDKPMTQEGSIVIESDTLHTTLADYTPMVLKWVNGVYESSAFGLPMRFEKK